MAAPEVTNATMKARMVRAALGLSLRRLAHSPTLLANTGIAAIPVLITLIIHLVGWQHSRPIRNIVKVHEIYEGFLRVLYLHFVVFFIANIMGSAVARQDREEQTLHYLFLQPGRRWMLIVGKLGAYLTASSLICVGSLWLTYLALGLPGCGTNAVVNDLFHQGRAVILAKESAVLMLGLLAYGTLAMLIGNFFKNATYSLLLLGWEVFLPYLPSTLKFWTIAHYLQSLLPERMNEQSHMFEMLGEPASLAVSLAVLIGVPCLFAGMTIFLFRYRECLYGET